MYDLHSHVLPKVDDGSKSIEETAALFSGMAEMGYMSVAATPHWAVGMPNISEDLIDETREVASANGISLSVARECRIHPTLTEHVLQNPQLRINGDNVVLVELPWGPIPHFTIPVFRSLLRSELRPVLVHPERHASLLNEDSPLDTLIDSGVILQMNIQSLTGLHGKDTRYRALSLLDQRKIDFVASDVHSENEIVDSLIPAHDILVKAVGEDISAILTTQNPQLLVENRPLLDLNSGEFEYDVDRSWLSEEGNGHGWWRGLFRPLGQYLGRSNR